MVKIIITGGGTGGHVFPGIAVAEALTRKTREVEVLFIGGAEGFEAKAVPAAGYRFAPVPARGLLGKRILALPMALWTVLRGLIVAYRQIKAFDPDVIFATGGYVSGPVALAGRLLGKPLVLHEQNSVPGITNRLLSRVAREVHINLASARKHFPRRRHLKLSGSPLRRGILEGDRGRARQDLGLERDRLTVVILGGSQGARSINRAAVGAIQRLQQRDDLQFVLQTGQHDFRWAQTRLRGARTPTVVRPFIEKMGDLYQLADLVVARAGAMTLAELSACGKASILVPFPHATHNHQEANARDLLEAGAAIMILDRDLSSDLLADEIAKLIDTPRKLREMSNNALIMARPDAAEKIADALLRYGGAAEEGTANGAGRSPAASNGVKTSVANGADEDRRRLRGRRARRSS
jgi:UDP-N-acetylglucosamine--N-acetylmuramyl-(pentapeptide) pyrophosphoryl-undecaprenol N-acetylglucosamine transferase